MNRSITSVMRLLKSLLRYSSNLFILIINLFKKITNRPIIKETVFLPDRKAPPLASSRDMYTVSKYTNINLYINQITGITWTSSTSLYNNNKWSIFRFVQSYSCFRIKCWLSMLGMDIYCFWYSSSSWSYCHVSIFHSWYVYF